MMKTSLLKFLGAFSLALATCGPANAITLSLQPTTQTISPGATAVLDLNVSGLGAGSAPSLGTFDVDISFDPAVLSFSGATFGDPILGDQLDVFGFGTFASATPGAGSVNLFELSFDPATDLDALQASDFTLARLTFDTFGAGVSPLTLSINALGDAAGDPLAATVASASVTVHGVPEPTTVSVIGLGLLGLALSRVLRQRSQRG